MTIAAEKLGYCTPIKDDILEAREDFFAWTNQLAAPLGSIVKKISSSHYERIMPNALLGECDAFWYGEVVGASKEAKNKAAAGFISGYSYIFHQDRQLDESEISHGGILASNLLYAKMLDSFQATAENRNEFWPHVYAGFEEFGKGCLWEQTNGRTIRRYSENDLKMVAARSAPVKIGIAALALSAGNEQYIPDLNAAVEQLIIGLQIRDDLADCRNDLGKGRYTYVISRLLDGREPDAKRLDKALPAGTTIEDLLSESTQRLANCSKMLALPADSSLQLYLDHISLENKGIVPIIRSDYRNLEISSMES